MKRTLVHLGSVFLTTLVGAGLFGQTAGELNEGLRLARDESSGVGNLSWWGRTGQTYFVQTTEDLMAWSYAPVIEQGANAVLSYGFTSNAPRLFFRLRMSDEVTANPNLADFDGDSVGNLAELLQGTDPFAALSADPDRIPDDWEKFYFGNLTSLTSEFGDANGNGWSNIAKLNLGMSPLAGSAALSSGAGIGNTPVTTWPFADPTVVRQSANPRTDAAGNELAVGVTAGQLGVNEAGAAAYTIPLALPPGTNGVAPSLALGYSSNAPNGLLGIGWSLQGLSVITRGASNAQLYGVNDFVTDPVDLTQDDRFFIDGQRLIATAGTYYGGDGTEYHTEAENFSKVVSKGSVGTGPGWFEVWTKSGLRMEYGNTADSTVVSGSAVLWLLNRVEDRNGNFYTVTYENHPGTNTRRPKEIAYTGSASVSPYNTVRLVYESRPDPILQHTRGASLDVRERLSRVDIAHASPDNPNTPESDAVATTVLRSYELSYDTHDYTRRSRLRRVQEIGLNGKRLPATTFAWTEAELGYTQATQGTVTNGASTVLNFDAHGDGASDPSHTFYTGDFNGDGLTDLLEVIDLVTTREIKVRLNTGGAFAPEYSFFGRASAAIFSETATNNLNSVTVADFNGDGLADLAMGFSSFPIYYAASGEVRSRNAQVDLYLAAVSGAGAFSMNAATGLSFADIRWTYQTDIPESPSLRPALRITAVTAPGSQNRGAQKAQLLVVWRSLDGVHHWNVREYFGGSWSTSYSGTDNQLSINDNLFPLESNGDGVSDLLIRLRSESGSRVLSRNKSGYALLGFPAVNANFKADTELMSGDFNGDGLSDLISYTTRVRDASNQWISDGAKLYLGRGDGMPTRAQDHNLTYGDLNTIKYRFVTVADLNGDGRDDLLLRSTPASAGAPPVFEGSQVWLADGDATSQPVFRQINLPVDSGPGKGDFSVLPLVFDRDALPDLFILGRNAADQFYWRIMRANGATTPDRLVSVTNGLGVTAAVTYSTLLDASVYTRGSDVAGLVNLQTPQTVVKTITRDNGPAWDGSAYVASTYTETYTYEGMRGQPGRGPVGFAAQTTTDSRTGVTTRVERRQDYPFTGFITRTTVKRGTLTLSDTVTTPAVKWLRWGNTNDRTFFTYADTVVQTSSDIPTSSTAGDKLATTAVTVSTVTSTQTFDDYGNPLVSSVDYGVGGRKATTTLTYKTADLSAWLIARPETSESKAEATGQPTVTRHVDFTYKPTGNPLRLDTVTTDASDPAVSLVASFTYDSFGNIETTTLVGRKDADTSQTRSSTVRWDHLGRFPRETENALGHTQTLVYNQLRARPSKITDANELKTTFGYDDFGRLVTATHPDDSVTTRTLRWTAGDDGFAVETRTTSSDGTRQSSPPSLAIYDRHGRATRTATLNADGVVTWQLSRYDTRGLPIATSAPYTDGTAATAIQWSTALYDGLARAWRQTAPNGTQTDQLFNGLTNDTVTTAPHGTETLTRKTRSVHDAAGLLTSVVQNPNLATNAVEYSAVSYTYDALGQIKTTTNPGGSQITVDYESLRAVRSGLTDPDSGPTTYETNAFGETYEQTDAKLQVTRLTYDVLGRVLSRTTDATGTAPLTTTWTYDTATGKGVGALATVTADDAAGGTTTETYTYDTLGRPLSVTRVIAGETYRSEITAYDALSQPTATRLTAGTGATAVTFNQSTHYNAHGYAREVRDADAGTILWSLGTVNAYDQPTTDYTGNGLTTTRVFDPADGTLRQIRTGRADGRTQAWAYTFDGLGNLRSRSELNAKTAAVLRTETFAYDTLDRLTTGVTYDQTGNITDKAGQAYAYTSPRTHAVTQAGTTALAYDANGNLLGRDGVTEFVWTAFNQPRSITRNGATASFRYGAGHQRIEQQTGAVTTRYAGSELEQIIGPAGTETRFYVFAAGRRLAQVAIKDGQKTVTYLHDDHLGSVESITDGLGARDERLSFDAWGQRRDAGDWTQPAPARTTGVTRGYTDHEGLEALGLIHMNGRLYDPALARFISPDPILQSPHNGQNRNRYSYVFNNPLSATDPSGYQALYYNGGGGQAQRDFNYWANSGGGGAGSWTFNFTAFAGSAYQPFGGMGFPRPLARGTAAGVFQNANIQTSWLTVAQAGPQEGLSYANQLYAPNRGGPFGTPDGTIMVMDSEGMMVPSIDWTKYNASIALERRKWTHWQALRLVYPENVTRRLIHHYIYGDGSEITLTAAEMRDMGATIDLNDSKIFREVVAKGGIDAKGREVSFTYSTATGEGHGARLNGSLANFGVRVHGTVWVDGSGKWHFYGNVSFFDLYDMDPKPPGARPAAAESRVTYARENIPGTAFPVSSESVEIIQIQGEREATWTGAGNQMNAARRNTAISNE